MAVISIPVEDDQGHSVWPERFSDEELAAKRSSAGLGELRYSQEYLVTPVSLFGADLNIGWLKLYDYDRCQEDNEFENMEYFFGVDPSITGTGDYMVICVIGKAKNKLYIIDFIREKADMPRIIQLIERTAMIYPPTIINVEAVAAQQMLVQELADKTILPVRSYIPVGKKEDRIAVMATVRFSSGQVKVRGQRNENQGGVVFDERMNAFVSEWLGFPRGKYDDTLDAAESALQAATSSGMAVCLSSEIKESGTEDQAQAQEYEIPTRRRVWW